MSHFSEITVDYSQACEKDLVASLELIFGKGHVEVHNQPVGLYGYQGDNRSAHDKKSPDFAPPCHIVIRRNHVGEASNDVGYRRLENGKYAAYISEYDQGNTFTKTKQHQVAQEYSLRVAERRLKTQGYTVKRQATQNGVWQLVGKKYS